MGKCNTWSLGFHPNPRAPKCTLSFITWYCCMLTDLRPSVKLEICEDESSALHPHSAEHRASCLQAPTEPSYYDLILHWDC